MDRIKIEVVNWAHYNPRSDRGGFSWFRMDNQFYLHMRQRKGLSARATVLMGLLLAEASSNNGEAFSLRLAFAAEMLGRPVKEIRAGLDELIASGEIRIAAQGGLVADTTPEPSMRLEAASTLTDGRTDGHVEAAADAALPCFDLEALYKAYPKRDGDQGKKDALKKLAGKLKSAAEYDRMKLAIERYSSHCRSKNIAGTSYVKQFKTFVGDIWEEWADRPGAPPPPRFGTLEDLKAEREAAHA